MIAIGLRDSEKIELLLPAELNGHEAAFLNAVDAIRQIADIATPGREIEVRRNCSASCLAKAISDKTGLSTLRKHGAGLPFSSGEKGV